MLGLRASFGTRVLGLVSGRGLEACGALFISSGGSFSQTLPIPSMKVNVFLRSQ